MSNSPISDFLDQNFLHFNARETVAAARSYKQHLEGGGKMLVSLAGAMSTAELGISLAEMIRTDKVHAISCTGANLEEDVFNLVAHNEYRVVPNYRDLSPTDETALLEEGFNRVTDTCIPETVMHGKMIISNIFILFALRRVLSLRSNLKIKKKLFDAAFWITLASLFYFWSILFFILIIAALFFHGIHQLKNLIIPFTGSLTVFLIIISYSVMAPSSDAINWFQIDTVSFDFSNYLLSQVVSITVLTTLGIYSMVFYVRKIGDKSSDFRSSFLLILISLFIGVGLVVIAPVKNTSELLFLFAPLSIIITNHIEAFSNKWLADFYLSVLAVIPFIQLML